RELMQRMPERYRVVGSALQDRPVTSYQVLVGKGTAFERDGMRLTHDFPDGTDNTILIVDASVAVPWTKPEDVVVEYEPLLPKLRHWKHRRDFFLNGTSKDGFIVVMANGGSRGVPPALATEENLRAWATRNGGEPVPKNW